MIDELLDKINVKLAGFCWQILRTTDTGGVKLIYNGDPDPTTGYCQSPTTEATHKALVGKQGLANVVMTGDFQYADTFTYDLNAGTFTLVNPTQDNYANNKGVVGKYTCKSSATTCSTLYYIGTTNLANSTNPYQTSYTITTVQNSIIGKTPWSTNLTSLAYNGYMYGDAYDHAGATAPTSGSIMGNDVYWNGSNYELRESDGSVSSGTEKNATHHYTCNTTSATCTGGTVRYYYYNNLYILLKNGDNIDTAVNRMLTANTHESLMKKYLELWYKNNMTSFTNYLEKNAVYCYDRRIIDYGGLSKDGDLTAYLEYTNYDYVYDLGCGNDTDKFSVGNTNAKIDYPVGLATGPEMLLIGNSTVRNTGQLYYLFSPLVWYNRNAYGRNITAVGDVNSYGINGSGGVRPVVTLAATNNTVTGTGTLENPYIIK